MAKLSQTKRAVPDGASFELMTNTGFKGRKFPSKFYFYSPSHPYQDTDLARMLNSVVFVYPNKPYANQAEAWEALVNTGLLDIAEKEVAYVIMPLAVKGDKWSGFDLNVYYDAQYYLAGGDVYSPWGSAEERMEYDRLAFNNCLYVIAEGDGATFVNDVLSQHAERIAGILTFGGHFDEAAVGGRGVPPHLKPFTGRFALPAYLVNAEKSAIAYYKEVNGVDTEVKSGVFVNSGYKLKKVITAKGGSTFDADIIADAWAQIFSRTTRGTVTETVPFTNKFTSECVLMDRPNYEELGITRLDHRNKKLSDGTVTTWCDFVPNSVLADKKTKVPLVIALHGGGDHPVYHVESNGWAAKAAEGGFVVISPAFPGPNDEGENVMLRILEYGKKTYPIDESRIYLAGFSMGGASTCMFGLRNADKFAAIAVMGAGGYSDEKTRAIVDSVKGKIDLPFAIIAGTKDPLTFRADENDNMALSIRPFGGRVDGLPQLMKINDIEKGSTDYAAYPYWGYPTEDAETLVDRGLKYRVSYMKKSGVPIAKLALFENGAHAHCEYFATLAWDFFSRFSRSADGSSIHR